MWNSKARSARLLHESTASDDLKLFLTYSSISAAYGNVGQAAYGAANAYLDALMEERVIAGQCGLSVQWPAISGVGMAAATLAMSGNRDGGRGILTEGTASPEDVDQLITDILSGKAGTGRSPVLQMAPKPMVTMIASLGIHSGISLAKFYVLLKRQRHLSLVLASTINRASVHKTKAQHIRRSKCVIL